MAVEHRGRVAGATPRARAVALAGRLAELGVTRVAIAPLGDGVQQIGWRELRPGETDLPGQLLSALEIAGATGIVELFCLDRPVRFECGRDAFEWVCADAGLNEQLMALEADTN